MLIITKAEERLPLVLILPSIFNLGPTRKLIQ